VPDADLEEWIIKLIADASGVDPERISADTSLNRDLGIDGDDATELLSLYSEAFGVDLSEFRFSQYFRDEPHLFNPSPSGRSSGVTPITVGDLVDAARLKKWAEIREWIA
jgi:acyl carrier protein